MEVVNVVGAGGIGCAVGYALRAAGVPVVFVEANPRKMAEGRKGGVRVDCRPALRAEFITFAEWAPRSDSIIILCTKCYDNAVVLAKIPSGAQLIPIQNGFDPQLSERDHSIEGVASFVSECAADVPHTRITRKGDLHLGQRGADIPVCPFNLAECLRTSGLFRVKLVPRIEPIKYTKLMYNAAISPLAAAAGIDNGQLLSLAIARKLFFGLLRENYQILTRAGIELGKVGPLHPKRVAKILSRNWLASLMAKFFEPSLRGTYCSMAGEIEKGRTEIDNYNGHLIELAIFTGTPCPLNRAVHALVSGMTHERTKPHIGALREIVARLGEGSVFSLGRSPPLTLAESLRDSAVPLPQGERAR